MGQFAYVIVHFLHLQHWHSLYSFLVRLHLVVVETLLFGVMALTSFGVSLRGLSSKALCKRILLTSVDFAFVSISFLLICKNDTILLFRNIWESLNCRLSSWVISDPMILSISSSSVDTKFSGWFFNDSRNSWFLSLLVQWWCGHQHKSTQNVACLY